MASAGRTDNHFLALDALRGIAALTVAATHIGWITSISNTALDRNGYLMVDFFFVLSGFVIALNYRDRIADMTGAAKFIWLRFWRLYPLHFTMLIVFLGIEVLKFLAQRRYGIVATTPAFGNNNLRAFLSNLALVQAFGINANDTFNPPAWSISTEFYTYGVFALVLLLATRQGLALVSVAICIATLSIFIALRDGLSHSYDWLAEMRCLYGFFLGVIAHELFRTHSNLRKDKPAISSSATPLVAIAAIVALILFKPAPLFDLLMPPLSAALIVSLALAPASRIGRVLTTPPMIWLGLVSYSIYMVHMAVIWVFDQAIRLGLHARPEALDSGRQLLSIAPLLGDAIMLLALAMVLVACHFTFRWIEAPLRDWSRRYLKSGATAQAKMPI